MMSSKVIRILLFATVAAFCVFVFSSDAAAQCALCRSALPQALAKNFNIAIVVLLAPPVTIFTAIFYIAFRNRKG
jgi:hypothetical protein